MKITALTSPILDGGPWFGEAVSRSGRSYKFNVDADGRVGGCLREEPEHDTFFDGQWWRSWEVKAIAPSALIVAARAALREAIGNEGRPAA